MKYAVSGTVTISITMLVEADSLEEAKEKAHEEYPGLTNFAGNGSRGGKLVGTSEENLTVEAGDDEPQFTDVEIVKGQGLG